MNGERSVGRRGGLTNYGDAGFSQFMRRSFARGMGYTDADMRRPVIGICNSWSELNHCNRHLRDVAEAVKRGVWAAGGWPLEFPTISLGEIFISPTAMLYRNLMAMDAEEMARAQPVDGVVFLANCDKTTPAYLMAAASANLPSLVVTGGPMLNGRWRGQDLGACTDCRRYWTEYRAGAISDADLGELEEALFRSAGHCMVMGTASTMAALTEALGMTLPGGAAIPAADSGRLRFAEECGRRAVALVEQDLRPAAIMTAGAIDNAIRVLMAIGGSTNAVVHLLAIAGRLGIDLPLERFDALSRETPLVASMRPSGRYQMQELFEAGGIPAVMRELLPLLDGAARSVTGKTVAENLASVPASPMREVVAALAEPFAPEGGLAVLYGNLAPRGAIIKHAAASPGLLQHRGRAVVFRSLQDMAERINAPDLDVEPDDVLVLQGGGPVGGPGMPEAGMIPIPRKLLERGVRDMVRISDARMSGTAYGTVVLHITPEAAVGGPLAAVRDGDAIELDLASRRLALLVEPGELQRRLADWRPAPATAEDRRGWRWLHARHVLQADQGCDLDFCRAGWAG
ncbi:MAG: dihydroxy-acid dehydratase [Thermomicrobiales bacterium]|nr:dihydroxy-acid dehydratase [Thermomicrobiales bacterium]